MNLSRPLKIIGVSAAIIAGLFIAAALTMRIMFPPEKIKALVAGQLQSALGRRVSVEKAAMSFFPVLGVSISGVEVATTARPGFSQKPFVKLDRLVVQIGLASIFRGFPQIGQLILKRPQIAIDAARDGSMNYDDLACLPQKGAPVRPLPVLPVPLSLKKFVIEDGMLTYSDARTGQSVIINAIDHKANLSLDKNLRNIIIAGELKLGGITLGDKGVNKDLKGLRVVLTHAVKADLIDGVVTIDSLRASVKKVSLLMAGTIKDSVWDCTIAADSISANDIADAIPREIAPEAARLRAGGAAALRIVIRGAVKPGAPMPLEGTLGLRSVTASFAGAPTALSDLNAQAAFTANRLDIKSLACLLDGNPVSLRGSVENFARPVVDLSMNAKINLECASRFAQLPRGAEMSGLVDAALSAKGSADFSDPAKLELGGKADLVDVNIIWPPLVKPARLNGTLSLSTRAIGCKMSARIGQSAFSLTAAARNFLSMLPLHGTGKTSRMAVDFKCASVLCNADEFMKTDAESEPATATGAADVPLFGPVPGVDLHGTITAATLVYRGVTLRGATVQVSEVHDVADIGIRAGFSGGAVSNALHAELRPGNAIYFIDKFSVRAVQLHDLIGQAGNIILPSNALGEQMKDMPKSLSGLVAMTGDISGGGASARDIAQSLSGIVNVTLTSGRIENAPIWQGVAGAAAVFLKSGEMAGLGNISFRDLSAAIRLQGGRACFDTLRIASDAGDWSIKGCVGFDASLALHVNDRLTRETSARILALENKAKSAVGGLLKGSPFEGAEGLLGNVSIIPRDGEGRVTVGFAVTGTASSPNVAAAGFVASGRPASGGAIAPMPGLKQEKPDTTESPLEKLKGNAARQLKKWF